MQSDGALQKARTCNYIRECIKLGVNQANIAVYLHAMRKVDEKIQPVVVPVFVFLAVAISFVVQGD
jgi:hypothetical protein